MDPLVVRVIARFAATDSVVRPVGPRGSESQLVERVIERYTKPSDSKPMTRLSEPKPEKDPKKERFESEENDEE
jgi:hypothetical protein